MRSDHQLLQWLSISQALENLRSMTKLPTSDEDLISLCEEDLCAVYINVGGLKGNEQVASIEEVPQSVFGAGHQRVLNSGTLRGLSSTAPTLLRMVGPVFTDCANDFDERNCVWEASVVVGSRDLRFKSSDIQALATNIIGRPGQSVEPEAREKRSLVALIAVLAEMSAVDISAPYKAAAVIQKAAATEGKWVPGEDTIVKYLKLAASADQP